MSNSSADLLRTLLFQHNAKSILSIGGSQRMLDLWNICELGDASIVYFTKFGTSWPCASINTCLDTHIRVSERLLDEFNYMSSITFQSS